jgi:hypothetical protein
MIKKILMKDALQWKGTTYETHLYQPTALDPDKSSSSRLRWNNEQRVSFALERKKKAGG